MNIMNVNNNADFDEHINSVQYLEAFNTRQYTKRTQLASIDPSLPH